MMMKVVKINLLVLFFAITFAQCSKTPVSISIDPGTYSIEYTIMDASTNNPISGAKIILKQYDFPDCKTCPISLSSPLTDNDGKANLLVRAGWSCDSAEVTAEGYSSKTFEGKPPNTIYLTPLGS